MSAQITDCGQWLLHGEIESGHTNDWAFEKMFAN
jgi:hypothetical protein